MSPIEQDLLDIMLDVIVIEHITGTDKFANPTFAAPVSVKCYITHRTRIAFNKEGKEIMTTVEAILGDPNTVVSVDDQITLSDGSKRPIHEVLSGKDDKGAYWLEVRA